MISGAHMCIYQAFFLYYSMHSEVYVLNLQVVSNLNLDAHLCSKINVKKKSTFTLCML